MINEYMPPIEIERLYKAVLFLARCAESGNWQGVENHVLDILYPNSK